MKKFVSVLLALAMTLALSVSALAAGTNTITVTGAQKDETYNIYKMLDLSVNEDKTAYTYTVNAAWKDFFTGTGAGAAYVDINDQGYVTWKTGMDAADKMEAFGKAAAAYAVDNKLQPAGTIKAPADDSIKFENLESGYYLITSTNGTLAMVDTTPTNPDATVEEKNPDTTIDKQVQEDSTGNYGDKNDADIGQTVNFQVTINVKKGAKNYVMHDQMTTGLTFDKDSVKIEGLTKGTDYTVVTDNLKDGCTFHVVFTQAYLDKVTGDTQLIVEYSAVLNEKAVAGTAETNKAKLNWGDKSETVWEETKTYTWKIDVYKYTVVKATEEGKENSEKALADAQFVLYKTVENVKYYAVVDANNKITGWTTEGVKPEEGADASKTYASVFTTPASGKFTITGLDSDTYYLEEIVAPAGYNLLKAPITVTVKNDGTVTYGDSTGEVRVLNSTGTELPSTGGMGTTIFYVLGGVLMAGAFVLLVVRKRMRTE